MNNLHDNNTIKPNQPVMRGYLSNDETRPKQPVKSKQNFQKILDHANQQEEELAIAEEKEEEQPVSVFDLARNKKKLNIKSQKQLNSGTALTKSDSIDDDSISDESALGEANETLSPFDEANGLARKKRFEIPSQSPLPDDDDMIAAADEQASLMSQATKNLVKKENPYGALSRYAQEGEQEGVFLKDKKIQANKKTGDAITNPSEIAYNGFTTQSISINPTGDSIQQDIDSHSFTLRQIIDKMVESIQVIQKEGLTETVVSLRYPPILEGATLTLSATDAAQKQFNIAFSSLTESAKAFLDARLIKDSLSNALEQQGFLVNTLITTTAPEITINPDQAAANQKQERNPEDPNERSRQKNQKRQGQLG